MNTADNGAPNTFNADWLSIPGVPTIDIPGVGKVPSKTVVAIGLLLLALAVVILAVRGAPAGYKRNATASRRRGGQPPADKPPEG